MGYRWKCPTIAVPRGGYRSEIAAKRAAVMFACGHEPEDDEAVEQLFGQLARQGWGVEIEL